jgi:hypothetical protein
MAVEEDALLWRKRNLESLFPQIILKMIQGLKYNGN